jgi:hypothetical protein
MLCLLSAIGSYQLGGLERVVAPISRGNISDCWENQMNLQTHTSHLQYKIVAFPTGIYCSQIVVTYKDAKQFGSCI